MRFPLAMLILLSITAVAVAAGDSPLDEADRAAFAWFDGIGLPSCAGLPFVRVDMVFQAREGKSQILTDGGFLLSEDDSGWTLLGANLWSRTIPKRQEGVSATLERLDLKMVAASEIARIRSQIEGTSGEELGGRLGWVMREGIGEHASILGFARHCAENGLEAEAHDLLALARRLPHLRDGSPITGPIEKVAAEQLGESVLWGITLQFEDLTVTREKLLERLRAHLRSFPESTHRPMVEEAVRILAAMVAEDAAHRGLSAEELAALPVAGRVRELVFRLRDQHGGQFMQPGSPSIYCFDDAEDARSPARALETLGFDAVPALIEALDDERFTRTVGFWRNFCFSHYVVRVGDAAREILEDVTGQRFWHTKYTAGSMIKDGEGKATKEKYRAWWRECTEFREPLRALAAERDPARRVELARAIPDRGPGLIPGGPEDALWGTGRFAAALPGVEPDAAKELLRVLMAESPHPRTRALAAWGLLDLGDRGGVPAMAALWKSLDAGARIDPLRGGAVASFLASCGAPEALAALAGGLDSEPAGVREIVLLAFADGGLGAVRGFAGGPEGGLRERWSLAGEAERTAERIVGGRLRDLEEDPLDRIPHQLIAELDRSFDVGRRIADAAIRILGRRWPKIFPYNDSPGISAEEWERLRTTFLATFESRLLKSR
ncbi:MAG: HEAT repeat domain-containing protein [Planctomycetes bacterium]|jgi:hypothetical protein|nr:HEAT repeat domain-containing protein [Planctomycetota bacterium]